MSVSKEWLVFISLSHCFFNISVPVLHFLEWRSPWRKYLPVLPSCSLSKRGGNGPCLLLGHFALYFRAGFFVLVLLRWRSAYGPGVLDGLCSVLGFLSVASAVSLLMYSSWCSLPCLQLRARLQVAFKSVISTLSARLRQPHLSASLLLVTVWGIVIFFSIIVILTVVTQNSRSLCSYRYIQDLSSCHVHPPVP